MKINLTQKGAKMTSASIIGKNALSRTSPFLLIALAVGLIIGCGASDPSVDPLPSWNDGEVKQEIIHFVTSVTTKDGPDFVPPEQRIATFDNDGTLWCEQPVIQGMFIMYKLERMVKEDPSLRAKQPFKAALENDKAYLKTEGMPAILELFSATHSGMTDEEFSAEVREFMAAAKHPKFGRGLGELTYQPMIELLEYLRSHGFKTFICSGGGIDFMRVISEPLYGIPPEQVIGSSGKKVFAEGEEGWSMTRTGELSSFNDTNVKAVNIDLHIGRRPLIAGGNVRSHGDIAMCAYSQGRKGPSLQLLVNHDDDVREYSYAEEDGGSLKAAKENGWIVVSMKKDWAVVFSTEEE